MSLKWSIFAVVVVAINIASAQIPSFGQCPEVKVQEDFDAKKYLGVWYEYEKYPAIFEAFGKCNHAIYGPQNDDGTISVLNSQINKFTGNKSNITGTAKLVEPGKLLVSFKGIEVKEGSNYWVLGTDYENYSVVFSCSGAGKVANAKLLWVLTRERTPSKDVINKAYAVIDANNLSKTFLTKTDHSDCPEPEV